MHRNRNLIFFILSCVAILGSCFFYWSNRPSYSLFTIADYGASYGRYISEAKFAAIIAFVLPFGALITLCSVPYERICRILAMAFGVYALTFAIAVFALVATISNSFPSPTKNPGIYLCSIFSVSLIAKVIVGKSEIAKSDENTKEDRQ